MPSSDIRDALVKKVNREMAEYEQQMRSMPGSYVFAHADEISAMKFCSDQLIENIHSYRTEYLEYLLRFEQPLSVVRDRWLSAQSDGPSEAFEYTLWDLWDKEDAEIDYAVDSGHNMC